MEWQFDSREEKTTVIDVITTQSIRRFFGCDKQTYSAIAQGKFARGVVYTRIAAMPYWIVTRDWVVVSAFMIVRGQDLICSLSPVDELVALGLMLRLYPSAIRRFCIAESCWQWRHECFIRTPCSRNRSTGLITIEGGTMSLAWEITLPCAAIGLRSFCLGHPSYEVML